MRRVYGTKVARLTLGGRAAARPRDHRSGVVNNAASGYVEALQHALFERRYQSSDLSELDDAATAGALGCHGARQRPGRVVGGAAGRSGQAQSAEAIDVVVTRDSANMLPGVDRRATSAEKGDRIA
jgi:acetolactate synthase-1/2/3 large subunit